MGYVAKDDSGMSLDAFAGRHRVRGEDGHDYLIRVFTIGELHRFQDALGTLLEGVSQANWARLLQVVLRRERVDWVVRARRVAGLPDMSLRGALGIVAAKDAEKVLDRIVRANLDLGLAELVAKCAESVKKKTAEARGATGARSEGACLSNMA